MTSIRRILQCEVLPDPGGWLGFAILGGAVMAHLGLEPDSRGLLFGWLIDGSPASWRGPRLEAALEGAAQAALIIAPALALYAGLRHLIVRADSLLPYVTLAGGGLLSLLTATALVAIAAG